MYPGHLPFHVGNYFENGFGRWSVMAGFQVDVVGGIMFFSFLCDRKKKDSIAPKLVCFQVLTAKTLCSVSSTL